MNYLAHIYLSFGHEELTVGNFISDTLRGTPIQQFTEGIQNGIRLHRRIDVFTDTHPIFLQSKHRFSGEFDKFSGILMDIYYDHILAKNFERYSPVPLQQYALQQYEVLRPYVGVFPDNAQRFFQYMTQRNILYEYSKLPMIEMVLEQLSRRIKHPCELHKSIPIFKEYEKETEEEFFLFFEELISYCKAQVELLLK